MHLGRGHSAVMSTSRAKIQNLHYNLVTVWFYSPSMLYTAITHMIIALELQSPVMSHWNLHTHSAVPVLYFIMCVIAVCANRIRNPEATVS